MANFGKHFQVDVSKGMSLDRAIKKGSFYRITILSERLIRLEYSKSSYFNDAPTDLVANRKFDLPKFDVQEDERYLIITTKYFTLQYLKESTFKGPAFAPDTNLKIKLNNTDKYWYYGHPEARNFLAGAYNLDDYNGQNKKLEKGLYSTDGFVTLDDSKPLVLNERGFLSEINEDYIDIYVFMYKRDFGLCLRDYFTLTGYPLLIPRYALGLWWYRDIIYSANDVYKLIDAFEDNDIPLSVLLLGEFWHEKNEANYDARRSGYSFNKKLFDDPKNFIDTIHSKNIKFGVSIIPDEGINSYDSCYKTISEDLQVKDNMAIPFNALNKMFITCYFEKIIDKLTALDIDFFWIDSKLKIKNQRALNYYHIKDWDKNEYKRPFLLTSNTNITPHRDGILYSGQTIASWNTLKFLPFYNANSCNIGTSWIAHDIGGFKDGIEDSELYLRYIQFATFSPIFKLSAKRGPYYKREPWLWDYKTYNIAKQYIKLRYKVIPYLYSEGYNYAKNGLPIIQPLYYNYPETYDEPNYRNEYYFGRELFISPITSPKDPLMNRVVQRVFLPKGVWYEFKSGKKFTGGKRYVTFYKDEDYPVFAKAGSVIPFAHENEIINKLENPEILDIYVFPGKNGTFKLYEDDGMTELYKQGYYNITSIDFNYTKDNYAVSIRPCEGNIAVIPNYRSYNIIFRNTKNILSTKATANGTTIDYKTKVEDNDFIVSVANVDSSKEIIIRCSGNGIELDSMQLINEDIDSIINDLSIKTSLKEQIAKIAFSDMPIKNKRIEITKLKKKGLNASYVRMFIKMYDYIEEN